VRPAAGKTAGGAGRDLLGTEGALRPIHDTLMAAIETFGPFEIAPKKGYVSLPGRSSSR
jgi:hypothetical protein